MFEALEIHSNGHTHSFRCESEKYDALVKQDKSKDAI